MCSEKKMRRFFINTLKKKVLQICASEFYELFVCSALTTPDYWIQLSGPMYLTNFSIEMSLFDVFKKNIYMLPIIFFLNAPIV